MKGRALTFRLMGTTGIDNWVGLVSKRWLVHRLAKKLMHGQWRGADPDATDLLIHTPWGTWRVVDQNGHIEPARPDRSSLGLM